MFQLIFFFDSEDIAGNARSQPTQRSRPKKETIMYKNKGNYLSGTKR
jgi:hypothetical protein